MIMVDRISRLMLCRWGMTLFFGLSMFGYLLQIATILSAFSAPENRIQLMGVVMLAPCVLLFSLASYLFSIAVEKHAVERDSKGELGTWRHCAFSGTASPYRDARIPRHQRRSTTAGRA